MSNKHLRSLIPYQLSYSDVPLGSSMPWNEAFYATTETPTHTGTATTDSNTKLVDTGADFSLVQVGDIVLNTTGTIYAKVTAIDSGTALSLNYDAFPAGNEDYSIYAAPLLPAGWCFMNGQTISDAESPFNGKVIQDWNSELADAMRTFDTGWVANSDWSNNELLVTHNLKANLSELIVKFFISLDGTDSGAMELYTHEEIRATPPGSNVSEGITLYQVSINSIKMQTGESTLYYINETGILSAFGSDYYKVVVYKSQSLGLEENEDVPWIFKYKVADAIAENLTVSDLTVVNSFNSNNTIKNISGDATLGSYDDLIYVDPTLGAVDLTLPNSPIVGKKQRIVLQHLGNGLIDRGDCEDTTQPMIAGETTPTLSNCTLDRSSEQSRNGTYSFKMTKTTVGGGGEAYANLTEGGAVDLHGLDGGETYTLSMWLYIPSSGGPHYTEVNINWLNRLGGIWIENVITAASITGAWQKISITLPISTTGVILRLYLEDLAGQNEYIYIDDIQLYRHYPVTLYPTTGYDIAGAMSIELNSDEDFAEILYNGNNFSLPEYYDHGRDVNNFRFERHANGILEQWGTYDWTLSLIRQSSTVAPESHAFYADTFSSLALPVPFIDEDNIITGDIFLQADSNYVGYTGLEIYSTGTLIRGRMHINYDYSGSTFHLNWYARGRWKK